MTEYFTNLMRYFNVIITFTANKSSGGTGSSTRSQQQQQKLEKQKQKQQLLQEQQQKLNQPASAVAEYEVPVWLHVSYHAAWSSPGLKVVSVRHGVGGGGGDQKGYLLDDDRCVCAPRPRDYGEGQFEPLPFETMRAGLALRLTAAAGAGSSSGGGSMMDGVPRLQLPREVRCLFSLLVYNRILFFSHDIITLIITNIITLRSTNGSVSAVNGRPPPPPPSLPFLVLPPP